MSGTYGSTVDTLEGKGLIAIVVHDGLKYSLVYVADSDMFDRYIPIVKTMIYSFEPISPAYSCSIICRVISTEVLYEVLRIFSRQGLITETDRSVL